MTTSEQLSELLDKLHMLKEDYQMKDDLAKKAKREHDAFQAEVFELMRETGLRTVRTDVATFATKSTLYAKVQDMDAFTEWVKATGLEDEFLRQKEVGARLNEYVREAVNNGTPLPEGTTWYPREYISITSE
jgi:trans-aconitate methyltransferase